MKIVDINGESVKANAVFDYKGFEISSSSIMNRHARVDSIGVFNDSKRVEKYFDTVEQAIEFVNKF
jgi:hypothetical protein